MSKFSLQFSPYEIAITGYLPRNGVIRKRGKDIAYNGPTIEFTATFPHDRPRTFNIPYPIQSQGLRNRMAAHSVFLDTTRGRMVLLMIERFARHVVEHHGWSKPYRPDDNDGDSVWFP